MYIIEAGKKMLTCCFRGTSENSHRSSSPISQRSEQMAVSGGGSGQLSQNINARTSIQLSPTQHAAHSAERYAGVSEVLHHLYNMNIRNNNLLEDTDGESTIDIPIEMPSILTADTTIFSGQTENNSMPTLTTTDLLPSTPEITLNRSNE